MQDYYQDYYQGDLGGFDPRTEAYHRKTSRFDEMAAGDAPTDESLVNLNRVAGGIVHGFKDLLTAISGNCSLALRGLPPEHPARPFLLEIQEAGEKAAGFARGLLDYDERPGLSPCREERSQSSN